MKLDTTTAKNAINIVLPIVLGGGILYWMYRGFDFGKLSDVCMHEMDWWWMGFSLIFGVTAQMFRGLRWKLALEPLGEKPRTANCIDAIFISYASSIIIPRIGEVSRCGILKQYDGTSFSKSLGTVVTERVIDSILVMVMTVVTFLLQIRMFSTFFDKTGTNLNSITERFTTTGYIVTAICGAAAIFFIWFLTKRIAVFAKVKEMMGNMKAGILSLKDVKNKMAFHGIYAVDMDKLFPAFLHYIQLFRIYYGLKHISSPRGFRSGQYSSDCTNPKRCRTLAFRSKDHIGSQRCRRRRCCNICTDRTYHTNFTDCSARRLRNTGTARKKNQERNQKTNMTTL